MINTLPHGRVFGTFLFLFLMAQMGYSQNIAINTSGTVADPSAILDVSAADKGMLIPRVSLTATNVAGPVTSPTSSLMVYNTATAGIAPNNVVPGYYYWNGTQWVQVITNLSMSNIYTASGSLTSARTVNLNGNTFRFQDNTQSNGGQTSFAYGSGARLIQSTTTGRADLTLQAGSSSLFLFQDVNSISQISAGGTSTGLAIGTPTGNATPIQFSTNGNSRMTITAAGNVGIGGSPAASALLDLSSSSQGFLAPRVALTATNATGPVTSPATGLLVYNTATAGVAPNNVVPAYYYWDGSRWVQIISVPGGTEVVNSVTGTAPIASSGGKNPVISLNDSGVNTVKLADDAVTSGKILDATVANADLATGTGGIYKGSGSLSGNTTVTGGANTLAFTSTATNGFSVDGSTFSVDAANNRVGIGNAAPGTLLHVTGDATNDPVRIENLLTAGSNQTGTLVTDATGVIKYRDANSISAARITGAITLATNNTTYPTNQTATPTETFDNLNEFSGNTFTAGATGLYQVVFKVSYDQRSNATDGADGYLGYAYIDAGALPNPPLYSVATQKVYFQEASGSPTVITITNSEVVKLTAGQGLRFRVNSYGSAGNVTANYIISISRID